MFCVTLFGVPFGLPLGLLVCPFSISVNLCCFQIYFFVLIARAFFLPNYRA
jgi:hypothetical protein